MLVYRWGYYRGRQRWRCGDCGHVGTQPPRDWIKAAYRDYVLGKQTLKQLSVSYGKAISTLQRRFDALRYVPRMLPPTSAPVSVVCDTTFFGRKYGVLVFRAEGKTLWWRFVVRETAAETRTGLHQLMAAGWRIQAITLDGKRSTLSMLRKHYPDIAVQLCQYHVIQGVRRILGPKPSTEFGQELLMLALQLTSLDKDSFADRFLYLTRYRFPSHLGRREERKATRAIKAIERALPYLFTYKNYPDLRIPNTTNSCEGYFGQWKQKIKLHRGTTIPRQQKMISFLLLY